MQFSASQTGAEKTWPNLQTTALVHEAYVRLVDVDVAQKNWNSRGHFFAAAKQFLGEHNDGRLVGIDLELQFIGIMTGRAIALRELRHWAA